MVERGYSPEQLRDTMRLIDAERSDLFDVLAYLAFAIEPTTREARVDARLDRILAGQSPAQRTFVQRVLRQYVEQGVDELDPGKLPQILDIQYGGTHGAAAALGSVREIRETFMVFQPRLYDAEGRE